ncbi:MAG: tetraacyldisaccharide 4'-kinase [Candidatus Marinimicrobia bacterium]|nr:tetraacyldisaccharide 4'-kinase [Candidatus Neomarinimicrobiota bacterium]
MRKLLRPIAGFYGGMTSFRNYLYDIGLKSVIEPDIPVISVGNITAGGTGKTPFTIALANQLVKKDFKPAIITRGYKRKSRGQLIVSEGQGPMTSAIASGDEPFVMAHKTRGVVIIADKNRVHAAKTARQKYNCDIIIADDAFQHRNLHRDVNIVLWDSYTAPEKEALLPKGRLRESFTGLNRADLIVLTRTENPNPNYIRFFNHFRLKCYVSSTKVTGIKNDEQDYDPELLNGRKLLAFCGLGNPQQFFDTVETLQPSELVTRKFSDHHRYSVKEIDELITVAKGHCCDFMVTTEKDKANIPEDYMSLKNLLFLSIDFQIGEDLLQEILKGI